MKAKAVSLTVITVLVMAFVLSLVSIGPVPASALPQMIEIEEDLVLMTVTDDEKGVAEINVSVRSPFSQNTIFNIESELSGAPFWTVDHPDSIYLEPFEDWEFRVYVTAPAAESAYKEVELSVTVSPEEGQASGEDTCRIRVLPYFAAEVFSEVDYLIDRPLSGSFDLTVRNEGNTPSPIGLDYQGSVDLTFPNDVLLDPGETGNLTVNYDISGETTDIITRITSFSGSTSEGFIDLTFIFDGGLVHILFDRGPFLILLPGISEKDSVGIVCLGGNVNNIGIDVVGEDEGVDVKAKRNFDMGSLDRELVPLEGEGYSGTRPLRVRAFGFVEEERITSNQMMIPVEGEANRPETISTATLVYAGGGTAAAGAAVIGSFAYLYSASEIFRYRWLLLAFIPLYSTIHGEKVLDHFFRGRLFEHIKEHPGSTFTALKEHFEVNNGTLTYHLHKLEREELIVHRNHGKYKLFYADGIKIKGVEAVISPIDRDIIDLVSANPGISSNAIFANLSSDRSRRTVSRHLKQLERKGFIKSDRKDGKRVFFITGDLERVLLPKRGVVEVSEMTHAEA